MPSTPRALGALEFPVPVLCDNGAPPQAPRLLPLNEGQPPAGPQGLSRTVGRGSHPKGRSGAKDPRSGLTAADDRARGRRAPSEARAFGYVRTNSHVFQQSPPLPFGHFDAVRRAGIRLPPCTFLNDFARLVSWSRAGRREPPTAPCVSNTWGGLVPRRSAIDECPVGSLRR